MCVGNDITAHSSELFVVRGSCFIDGDITAHSPSFVVKGGESAEHPWSQIHQITPSVISCHQISKTSMGMRLAMLPL